MIDHKDCRVFYDLIILVIYKIIHLPTFEEVTQEQTSIITESMNIIATKSE